MSRWGFQFYCLCLLFVSYCLFVVIPNRNIRVIALISVVLPQNTLTVCGDGCLRDWPEHILFSHGIVVVGLVAIRSIQYTIVVTTIACHSLEPVATAIFFQCPETSQYRREYIQYHSGQVFVYVPSRMRHVQVCRGATPRYRVRVHVHRIHHQW